MGSAASKTLFAFLVVAGAAATNAQPAQTTASTDRPTEPQLLLASAGDVATATGAAPGKPLLVATATGTSTYSYGRVARRSDLAAPASNGELKEWMLIAMGIFLIGAMSHRRSRAFTN